MIAVKCDLQYANKICSKQLTNIFNCVYIFSFNKKIRTYRVIWEIPPLDRSAENIARDVRAFTNNT